MTSVMTDYIHVSDGGEVSFIPGEMTDNRTTELLPCPFCGGEVQWKDGRIRCENCDFGFRRYFDHERNSRAWNTRAELVSGTCKNVHEPPRNTTFWPTPHFKCSECGASHVSMDYVYYCPNCGREVVSGC